MKVRNLLLGAALALSAPLTAAQAANTATNGLYLGGAAGANFATDSKVKPSGGTPDTAKFDTGGAGSLSVGYGFGNGFRAELEASYRNADVKSLKNNNFAVVKGSTDTWGVLVNGFYDINTGTRLTPYIGAGVGVAVVNGKLSGDGTTLYNSSDTQFAYQGIAGVSYALTGNLALTADYRYLGTTDTTFKGGAGVSSVKASNGNHTILAGVRWTFDAPASR